MTGVSPPASSALPCAPCPRFLFLIFLGTALNLFYDDGEGCIDLGLYNVFDFDEEGNLLGDVGKRGNPYGYVTGVQSVYSERETETTAKSDSALREGDTLEFPCDGYGYGGTYQDSFLPGAPPLP